MNKHRIDTATAPTTPTNHLHSHEQLVLDELHAVIGKDTVSRA